MRRGATSWAVGLSCFGWFGGVVVRLSRLRAVDGTTTDRARVPCEMTCPGSASHSALLPEPGPSGPRRGSGPWGFRGLNGGTV